jgi:hypothetical protein
MGGTWDQNGGARKKGQWARLAETSEDGDCQRETDELPAESGRTSRESGAVRLVGGRHAGLV